MMMTHALFNCTILLFSIKDFYLLHSTFCLVCFFVYQVKLVTFYLYADLSGVFVVNARVSGSVDSHVHTMDLRVTLWRMTWIR